MKKLIILSLAIIASISLYAQDNTTLTKVFLQDGTSINAYVEIQPEGGYKITTEDGAILFFREGEISINKPFKKSRTRTVQANTQKQTAPQIQYTSSRYKDLKKIYSAKDYNGYMPGDRYNPTGIWWASFLVPGLGQYITGSQVGWGLLQTFLSSFSISFGVTSLINGAPELAIPGLGVWAGTAIWSACSACKAAKIKNLYYRDVRNGVAFKFDIAPYFDVAAPTLACNSGVVSGVSLKISF